MKNQNSFRSPRQLRISRAFARQRIARHPKTILLVGLLVLSCFVSLQVQTAQAQFTRILNQHFDPNSPHDSIRVAQAPSQRQQHPFAKQAVSNNVKTVATNLRGFGVPFKISADNDAFIEVQLYLSRDMGQTWSFHARQSTDKQEFPFQADSDGEYWFALKTLNRDRKLVPDGDPTPELRIVVDSEKPKLDFRVETDPAGRVVCRWRAEDDNLAPQSLRIYYQSMTAAGPSNWRNVPVKLNGTARGGVYADQLAWWPDTTEQSLNVAVEIADLAGNKVQLERQVVVPQSAWRSRSQSTAQITDRKSQSPAAGGNEQDVWAQPNEIQGPSRDLPAQPTETTSQKTAAHHPPNVVCKDGVCTLVPVADAGHGFTAKRIPSSSSAKPRSANNQPFAKPPLHLIGSEVEFAAPPVPEGYDDNQYSANRRSNTVKQQRGRGSVVWKSETEKWVPKNQTSFSSTVRSDPAITPNPYPESPTRRPVTDVPSNPSNSRVQGDQIVGESSTMGPNNQYRGMNSQGGQAIPSPTLLPGVSGAPEVPSEVVAVPTRQETGQASRQPTVKSKLGGAWNTSNQPHDQSQHNRQPGQQNPMMPSGYEKQKLAPIKHSRAAPIKKNPSRAQQNSLGEKQRTPAHRVASRKIGNTSAPTQIIGSKRFRLSYGIDAIDPSGVARVDLWITRDQGVTWNAWGSDPDSQSPFPVEVQEEGHYGFRVVVHSKDGLTGQGPSSGDDADMWVLVDTQSPLTRITAVPYGRGEEAGRLVINYAVSDIHLTLRPITLSFSGNPQGPWTKIEEGVRNESRFVWKVKTNVPDRIFLRIEAVDKAGNIGVHVPSQAIDVSGLVPRGTIHAVSPVGVKRN